LLRLGISRLRVIWPSLRATKLRGNPARSKVSVMDCFETMLLANANQHMLILVTSLLHAACSINLAFR
jgi:hypothetical protein